MKKVYGAIATFVVIFVGIFLITPFFIGRYYATQPRLSHAIDVTLNKHLSAFKIGHLKLQDFKRGWFSSSAQVQLSMKKKVIGTFELHIFNGPLLVNNGLAFGLVGYELKQLPYKGADVIKFHGMDLVGSINLFGSSTSGKVSLPKQGVMLDKNRVLSFDKAGLIYHYGISDTDLDAHAYINNLHYHISNTRNMPQVNASLDKFILSLRGQLNEINHKDYPFIISTQIINSKLVIKSPLGESNSSSFKLFSLNSIHLHSIKDVLRGLFAADSLKQLAHMLGHGTSVELNKFVLDDDNVGIIHFSGAMTWDKKPVIESLEFPALDILRDAHGDLTYSINKLSPLAARALSAFGDVDLKGFGQSITLRDNLQFTSDLHLNHFSFKPDFEPPNRGVDIDDLKWHLARSLMNGFANYHTNITSTKACVFEKCQTNSNVHFDLMHVNEIGLYKALRASSLGNEKLFLLTLKQLGEADIHVTSKDAKGPYALELKIRSNNHLYTSIRDFIKKANIHGSFTVPAYYIDNKLLPIVRRGTLEQADEIRQALADKMIWPSYLYYTNYFGSHQPFDGMKASAFINYLLASNKLAKTNGAYKMSVSIEPNYQLAINGKVQPAYITTALFAIFNSGSEVLPQVIKSADAGNADSQLALAMMYLGQAQPIPNKAGVDEKKYDESVKWMNKAIENNSVSAKVMRAVLLVGSTDGDLIVGVADSMQKYREGLKELEQLHEQHPHRLDISFMLGRAYTHPPAYAAAQYEKGLKLLASSRKLAPFQVDAAMFYAYMARSAKGDDLRALKVYQRQKAYLASLYGTDQVEYESADNSESQLRSIMQDDLDGLLVGVSPKRIYELAGLVGSGGDGLKMDITLEQKLMSNYRQRKAKLAQAAAKREKAMHAKEVSSYEKAQVHKHSNTSGR